MQNQFKHKVLLEMFVPPILNFVFEFVPAVGLL